MVCVFDESGITAVVQAKGNHRCQWPTILVGVGRFSCFVGHRVRPVCALFAPYLKTIGLALFLLGLLSPKRLPVLHIIGKLAMADVFLTALCIIITKCNRRWTD